MSPIHQNAIHQVAIQQPWSSPVSGILDYLAGFGLFILKEFYFIKKSFHKAPALNMPSFYLGSDFAEIVLGIKCLDTCHVSRCAGECGSVINY